MSTFNLETLRQVRESLPSVPPMLKIFESPLAMTPPEQFRFPRSKKRRIRSKWAKRHENYRQRPAAFRMGDKIIIHPALLAKLRN